MKTIAVVLFMALGLLLSRGEHLSAQDAYIREFTGTVELKAPGAEVWTRAVAGERLSKDTRISTGFKSTALIALGNSTLIVRPLTRLSLEEIQNIQGDELVRLSLQTGRVRAEVSPPQGGKTDFTVHSPMATASVRGTSFDFDGINLSVDQGLVHVTGGNGSAAYVGAGHQSVSDPHTGKTAGVAVTTSAGLAPELPAAAGGSIPVPAAIVQTPEDKIAQTADANVGFDWD